MKRWIFAVATTLACSSFSGLAHGSAPAPGGGEPTSCVAGTSPQVGAHWLRCETELEGQSQQDAKPSISATANQASAVSYSYVWVPTCPGASPAEDNLGEIECFAAHSCADPRLLSMSLYAMQLTNAAGERVRGGWQYLGSECRDPKDAGPTQQPQPRVLTWSDVLSAVRQVGVPGASVQSPHYTLVNLDTTFYTEPATLDRALQIIGYDVEVHVQPSTYTWHWGDGSSETTNTPGQPYPSTDVTHTYVHATSPGQAMRLRVDVTYTARYRVDGGEWQDVPESLTIPGAATDLPIKQASAVLVAGN